MPQNKESEFTGNQKRTHDFLGNSKTDSLIGLFRRKTVIHGDKKTDKQVVKDKKVSVTSGVHLGFSNFGSTAKGKNKTKTKSKRLKF